MTHPFIIGDKYSNEEIRVGFKCSNTGGMRRSRAFGTLVIISDHTKSLYDDKWYGDVLHYTGMGKLGDQDINFMQNRTLAESKTNAVHVHLFEVLVPKEYIYLGEVVLDAKPYKETQKDDAGNERLVWMFPVKRVNRTAVLINEEIAKNEDKKRKISSRLTLAELREIAENSGSEKVSSRTVASNVYVRDVYISEYAKRRANGYCQLCEQRAPFTDKSAKPYLESHHIEWISEGGSDTIENTVALCPNCHRKMHVLRLDSDIEKLKNKVIHFETR